MVAVDEERKEVCWSHWRIQPCPAGQQQENCDVWDPILETAAGVEEVLVEAAVLVLFLAASLCSVLSLPMSLCWGESEQHSCCLDLPMGASACAPLRLEWETPHGSGRALHLTSLKELAGWFFFFFFFRIWQREEWSSVISSLLLKNSASRVLCIFCTFNIKIEREYTSGSVSACVKKAGFGPGICGNAASQQPTLEIKTYWIQN